MAPDSNRPKDPIAGNGASPQTGARVLTLRFVTADAAFADGMIKALQAAYLKRNAEYSIAFSQQLAPDIGVYSFSLAELRDGNRAGQLAAGISQDAAPIRIFLEVPPHVRQGPQLHAVEQANTVLAQIAAKCGGYVIPVMSKFLRWDTAALMSAEGLPSTKGFQAIAGATAKFIDLQVVRRRLSEGTALSNVEMRGVGQPQRNASRSSVLNRATNFLRIFRGRSKPGVDVSSERIRASFESAMKDDRAPVTGSEILASLDWKRRTLPGGLRSGPHRESVERFVDGELYFASYPAWGRIPFSSSPDWSMPGPNRSWQAYFLGLEFLSPVLGYLHAVASDEPDRGEIAAIARFLQSRSIGEAELLERIGAIVVDFVAKNPPNAPQAQRAWHEGTVCRRLKNFLLFLLCLREAAARGVAVQDHLIQAVFAGTKDLIGFLRNDTVYIKSGNHGVKQDVLLIDAGLLMSTSPFGREILAQGLARLQRWQLQTALSRDGVWLENSFGYHCMMLGEFVQLVEDLEGVDAEAQASILDAVTRMAVFTEALIGNDGRPPLIGDTEPRQYLGSLRGARRVMAKYGSGLPAGAKLERTKTTYHFPDGGYFVSHTSTDPNAEGSSLIVCASLRNPKHKHSDDLSILFSHNNTDLLIDGGTYNKETSDKVRNAARFDPGAHNTYRVNDKGYPLNAVRGPRRVSLEKTWSGDGWVACEAASDAYPDGRVTRLTIHLKKYHAIVVLDRLVSRNEAVCKFEQFWHIAPQFARILRPPSERSLIYASKAQGRLLVAVDGDVGKLVEGFGGPEDPLAWLMLEERTVPTPYLKRALQTQRGVMASAFQWSALDARLEVAVTQLPDGFRIETSGVGFSAIFEISRGMLTCTQLLAGDSAQTAL